MKLTWEERKTISLRLVICSVNMNFVTVHCRTARGVSGLDGARGKKYPLDVNVLHWRKYLRHGARGIVLPFTPSARPCVGGSRDLRALTFRSLEIFITLAGSSSPVKNCLCSRPPSCGLSKRGNSSITIPSSRRWVVGVPPSLLCNPLLSLWPRPCDAGDRQFAPSFHPTHQRDQAWYRDPHRQGVHRAVGGADGPIQVRGGGAIVYAERCWECFQLSKNDDIVSWFNDQCFSIFFSLRPASYWNFL